LTDLNVNLSLSGDATNDLFRKEKEIRIPFSRAAMWWSRWWPTGSLPPLPVDCGNLREADDPTGSAPDPCEQRGSSVTSKPVALLMADLGVTKSHSRPSVSNDNPYSESQFKTMK